jgi:hypothetical protein
MKAEDIKAELEKNYGWNFTFSSEQNMEMYYELFLDVQKVVLRQPLVSGSLDLDLLEKRLDEALSKETSESLNKWLKGKRQ